jgi:hypothetical protein
MPVAVGMLGICLLALGLSLVLDDLSVRVLLADFGAWSILRIVSRSHDRIQHSGAQVLELALALSGAGLTVWSLLHLVTPGARRWVRLRVRRFQRRLGLPLLVLLCGAACYLGHAAVLRAA